MGGGGLNGVIIDYHKSCNIYSFFHSPTRITKIILLVVIHQHIKQSVIKQKSVEETDLGLRFRTLAGTSMNKPLYISEES